MAETGMSRKKDLIERRGQKREESSESSHRQRRSFGTNWWIRGGDGGFTSRRNGHVGRHIWSWISKWRNIMLTNTDRQRGWFGLRGSSGSDTKERRTHPKVVDRVSFKSQGPLRGTGRTSLPKIPEATGPLDAVTTPSCPFWQGGRDRDSRRW